MQHKQHSERRDRQEQGTQSLTVSNEGFWKFAEEGLEQGADNVDIHPSLILKVKGLSLLCPKKRRQIKNGKENKRQERRGEGLTLSSSFCSRVTEPVLPGTR